MIAQSKNRVQAIKHKFENLGNEHTQFINNKTGPQLNKLASDSRKLNRHNGVSNNNIEENGSTRSFCDKIEDKAPVFSDPCDLKPNSSYLYCKNDLKRTISEGKTSLSRQTSDPGKKLHRSHAFRCDRSKKISDSPKRHGSCNGRSETSDFTLKMADKKLSKDRLKLLGNFLEDQMRKENFVPSEDKVIVGAVQEVQGPSLDLHCTELDSIPDSEVPQHILAQYAKVIKPKRVEKQEAMTDSGVSSETENIDDEKISKVKNLTSQFELNKKTNNVEVMETTKSNLEAMDDLGASSETMRLERKNPHLILTDTLKKALKQPLPLGPPPKKPPRTFVLPEVGENDKKDVIRKLEKLEQYIQKKEATTRVQNLYDIAESSPKKPKEIHYLCTEINEIMQRTIQQDAITKCFNSLNCALINNSTNSLPYTRLSSELEENHESSEICSCRSKSAENSSFNTFLAEKKCPKCLSNDVKHDRFKCHLNCNCKMEKSEFFIEKEHIYDVPCVEEIKHSFSEKRNNYGVINRLCDHSKSMEDLRCQKNEDRIYDIPFETARPNTPEVSAPKSDFQKLRQNFEVGFSKENRPPTKEFKSRLVDIDEKPMLKPKPILAVKNSKSVENLVEECGEKFVKNLEKNLSSDTKRYRNKCQVSQNIRFSPPKNGMSQIDVDKENLKRLMTEINETVTAACKMDENRPRCFPTDQSDGSNSEDSTKLTRSLTEKRKNYVRRVSSRVAYLDTRNVKRFRNQTSICSYKSEVLDNPYSTFRSWKSFRTSHGNIARMDAVDAVAVDGAIDNKSLDEKTGCVDIELPFEPRERGLFNLCLLVGLNYMTGQAYVKSVFPSQVQVPPHIENLIFPETLNSASKGEWTAEASSAQCYSLVLTDERGERSYGYCRRVLPEGATTCLPLCYCLIGRYRAPGFYYKVLQEIESHHGSSEVKIHTLLQQLFELDFPNPGEEININFTNRIEHVYISNVDSKFKSKTMPDMRRSDASSRDRVVEMAEATTEMPEVSLPNFYDLENNNDVKMYLDGVRMKTIKHPIEPRVDEDNLSILLNSFGANLVIKVFGSLLLERKVIIISDKLSTVSSCMEALQSSLYPFVWQQPLISCIPAEIQRDVLEAPLPILAGVLKAGGGGVTDGILFEEGILIDLTHPNKVLFHQGDESTILPPPSYKTLKASLHMESSKNKQDRQDNKTRNVMISEAFLRFFVDILGDYWKYVAIGSLKEGDMGKGDVVFDKDAFIKNASTKQNQYFLEWFTETAMFNHFVQNMCSVYRSRLHNSPETPPITVNSPQTPPITVNSPKTPPITVNSPTTPPITVNSPQTPPITVISPQTPPITINSSTTPPITVNSPQTPPITDNRLVDTPLPNFYELFEERIQSKLNTQKNLETKSNYKNAVNKKVKLLKIKLKELVT